MDAVQRTIGSLLTLATPQSQLRLAYRKAADDDRFLLVALQDGEWLAIDLQNNKRAYLLKKHPLHMTPGHPLIVELKDGGLGMVEPHSTSRLEQRPAPDGEYRLWRAGKVVVKRSVVSSITGTPQTVVAVAALP